jgi:hypothetical protein
VQVVVLMVVLRSQVGVGLQGEQQVSMGDPDPGPEAQAQVVQTEHVRLRLGVQQRQQVVAGQLLTAQGVQWLMENVQVERKAQQLPVKVTAPPPAQVCPPAV